ncbi:MAG: hypothetical protein ACI8R8_000497, partial [Paraglaciecola sp.]
TIIINHILHFLQIVRERGQYAVGIRSHNRKLKNQG